MPSSTVCSSSELPSSIVVFSTWSNDDCLLNYKFSIRLVDVLLSLSCKRDAIFWRIELLPSDAIELLRPLSKLLLSTLVMLVVLPTPDPPPNIASAMPIEELHLRADECSPPPCVFC